MHRKHGISLRWMSESDKSKPLNEDDTLTELNWSHLPNFAWMNLVRLKRLNSLNGRSKRVAPPQNVVHKNYGRCQISCSTNISTSWNLHPKIPCAEDWAISMGKKEQTSDSFTREHNISDRASFVERNSFAPIPSTRQKQTNKKMVWKMLIIIIQQSTIINMVDGKKNSENKIKWQIINIYGSSSSSSASHHHRIVFLCKMFMVSRSTFTESIQNNNVIMMTAVRCAYTVPTMDGSIGGAGAAGAAAVVVVPIWSDTMCNT